MKTKIVYPVLLFGLLLLNACSTDLTKAKAVSPQELSELIANRTVADEAVYLGSDSEYHYFAYAKALSSEHLYKIQKSELAMTNEYEVKKKRTNFRLRFNQTSQQWEGNSIN